MSYWNGCSTGGRQGLKEAQRFPNDYDGIVAGAAANPRTRLSSWQIWLAQGVLGPQNHIPASKYRVIHKAVLEACDATDGLKDGLISDPTRCHFDPKTIECKGADAPTCLTAGQVAAAERMYTAAEDILGRADLLQRGAWERTRLGHAGARAGAVHCGDRSIPLRRVSRTRVGIGTRSIWIATSRWPTTWITTPSTRPIPI